MMNELRRRLVAFRDDERGFSLPDVMTGVVVTGITVTLVAGAVSAFASVQSGLEADSAVFATSAAAETRWRADTQRSVAINVTADAVEFVLTPAAGKCTSEKWAFVDDNLTVTQTAHKNASVLDGKCTGVKTGSSTETVLPDTSDASFRFQNAGGRTLTFAAGVATPAPDEVKPAEVTDTAWASTAVRFAGITAAHQVSSEKPLTFDVLQLASQIPSLAGSPAGSTTFIAP